MAAWLRWSLDTFLEGPELDAQVLGGRVSLSEARLRQLTLAPGVSCSGSITKLEATWSWLSLLTSPVTVKATGLFLRVTLDSAAALGGSRAIVDAERQDRQSQRFFDRLQRRIWDTLRLEVHEVHVQLEVPIAGPSACKAEPPPPLGASGAVLGLAVRRITISSDGAERSMGLRSTAEIRDAGLYVLPLPYGRASGRTLGGPCQPPGGEAFIVRGLSPICRAVRTSGRRFVDWRGLEVQLEVNDPELSCGRDQYGCLMFLVGGIARCMERGRGAQPQQPMRAPSEILTPSSSWAWWPWQSSPADPGPAPDSHNFFQCISTTDQELLFAEDAPPLETATFQLGMALQSASLTAVDDFWHARLQGSIQVHHRTDAWEAEVQITELVVSDMSIASDDGFAQVCSQRKGAPTPLLTLKLCSGRQTAVSIALNRLDIQLSPRVLHVLDGVTHLSHEAPAKVGTPVPEEGREPTSVHRSWEVPICAWSVSWCASSVRLTVGDPWFEDCTLALLASSSGCAYDSGLTAAEVRIAADLSGAAVHESILEECMWSLDIDGGKATVRSSSVALNCSLQDFIRLHQCARTAMAGFAAKGAGDGGRPPLLPAGVEVHVGVLACRARDAAGGECAVRVIDLASTFQGDGGILSVRSCQLHVSSAGIQRGQLRLTAGSFWWAAGKAAVEGNVQAEVEVLDSAARTALRCPALQLRLSWERGLCRAAGLWYPIRVAVSISLGTLLLDTSEEFIADCKRFSQYLSDIAKGLSFQEFVFDKRPLGIQVSGSTVVDVWGSADQMAMVPGSTISSVQPPVDVGTLAAYLEVCPLPVKLSVVPPPKHFDADVSIDAFTLHAARLSACRGINISLEKVDVHLEGFDTKRWHGTVGDLAKCISSFYLRALESQLPALVAALSVGGNHIVASAIGAAVGGGILSWAGPAGVAAGAALGAAAAGGGLRKALGM